MHEIGQALSRKGILDALSQGLYNRRWTFSGGGYAQATVLEADLGRHNHSEVGISGVPTGGGNCAYGHGGVAARHAQGGH
jgi:hypothetical protein